MSFWSWFSTGSKAADTAIETGAKVVEAGINALDAVFFTEEERAQFHKELADQWMQIQLATKDESSIRSVTRRVIAFLIIGPFVLVVLGAVFVWPFNPAYAGFLLQVVEGYFGGLALGVAAFYFGPHLIGRAFRKQE